MSWILYEESKYNKKNISETEKQISYNKSVSWILYEESKYKETEKQKSYNIYVPPSQDALISHIRSISLGNGYETTTTFHKLLFPNLLSNYLTSYFLWKKLFK